MAIKMERETERPIFPWIRLGPKGFGIFYRPDTVPVSEPIVSKH